jgi:hypothetical protein
MYETFADTSDIGLLRIPVWQAVGGVYGVYYLRIGATVALSGSASAPLVATLMDVTGLVI